MILDVELSGVDLPVLEDACDRGTILPVKIEVAGHTFIVNQRIAAIRHYTVKQTPMMRLMLEEDEPRTHNNQQ